MTDTTDTEHCVGGTHCDHFTGEAARYGEFGGKEDWRCCWCGRRICRPYVWKKERVEGHGEFFTVSKKEYTE